MAFQDPRIPFLFLVLICLGLFGFYVGIQSFRRKRLIEDIPTSKARSVAMGLAEVAGEAEPCGSQKFKGPLTGKDCVHCVITVERLVKGRRSSHWVMVNREEKGDRFYLKDDTGKILVSTIGAEMDVPADYKFQTGLFKDVPKEVMDYVASKGIVTKDFIGMGHTMRYTEYDVEVGKRLFVLGTAAENTSAQRGDGVEDDRIVIKKGDPKQLFFISEQSEKQELGELLKKSLLGTIGGAALTVFGILLMMLYFNIF